MELYLASGVLKGIGPKTADQNCQKIWYQDYGILLKMSLKDLLN